MPLHYDKLLAEKMLLFGSCFCLMM